MVSDAKCIRDPVRMGGVVNVSQMSVAEALVVVIILQ